MLLMPFENRDNLAKDAQEECVAMNDHEFLEPPIIETMPVTSLENDLKIQESCKNKQVFLGMKENSK